LRIRGRWQRASLSSATIYLTIEAGLIYCLDAKTGCTYWTINACSGSRGYQRGRCPGSGKVRHFGDEESNVHAVNAATSKLLEARSKIIYCPVTVLRCCIGIASTCLCPLLFAGRDIKYECCTFRGSIVALDAYWGSSGRASRSE
jgi:polyvinyl alcohol dehydrogenase (cytochrome)